MSSSEDSVKNKMSHNLHRKIEISETWKNGKSESEVNAEYFQALEQWLDEMRTYRYCNLLAGLPYAMFAQHINGFSCQSYNVNSFVTPLPPINQGLGLFNFARHFPSQPEQQPHLQEGTLLKFKQFHFISISAF